MSIIQGASTAQREEIEDVFASEMGWARREMRAERMRNREPEITVADKIKGLSCWDAFQKIGWYTDKLIH